MERCHILLTISPLSELSLHVNVASSSHIAVFEGHDITRSG